MDEDDQRRIACFNEISALARGSSIGLLAYPAFVFVTLLGVQDADFLVFILNIELLGGRA